MIPRTYWVWHMRSLKKGEYFIVSQKDLLDYAYRQPEPGFLEALKIVFSGAPLPHEIAQKQLLADVAEHGCWLVDSPDGIKIEKAPPGYAGCWVSWDFAWERNEPREGM